MATRSIAEPSDGRSNAPDSDDLRARLHGMWAAVAGSWAAHAGYIDARGADVTEAMLNATAPQPGERVLELACGPGSVGLAAAARVAPGGEVVLSDVVAEMTAIASARADACRLDNVSTRELDLERIDEPDASYDVALCREGLMLVPDPARAAREIRRVLRPGGRIALAVWGPRARNPWLGVVFDSVGAQLGRPVPPPGVPGPFSLDDPDRLAGLLADAGLSDVSISELPTPLRAGSPEEWWATTCALAGPLTRLLALLTDDERRALWQRARDASGPYATPDGGLELPGLALLATARRP